MGLINNVIIPWALDGESMCMLNLIKGNWGMARKIIAYPLPFMTDKIKMTFTSCLWVLQLGDSSLKAPLLLTTFFFKLPSLKWLVGSKWGWPINPWAARVTKQDWRSINDTLPLKVTLPFKSLCDPGRFHLPGPTPSSASLLRKVPFTMDRHSDIQCGFTCDCSSFCCSWANSNLPLSSLRHPDSHGIYSMAMFSLQAVLGRGIQALAMPFLQPSPATTWKLPALPCPVQTGSRKRCQDALCPLTPSNSEVSCLPRREQHPAMTSHSLLTREKTSQSQKI